MNNTSTFQFLFHDLLILIDDYQIEYGYGLFTDDIETSSRSFCYWDLDIWKVCGSNTYVAFHGNISRIVKNIMNEIKNEQFELIPVLPFLSQKIKEKIEIVQLFKEWDKTQIFILSDSPHNPRIEFSFQGDPPDDFHPIVRDQEDYAYLINKLKPYFDLVSQELNRIFSFLSHLQNLNQLKLDKINPSPIFDKKNKLNKLAQKGKITELISELEKDNKILSNKLFTNLSARWHKNEEMKKMNSIDHGVYNMEYASLIELSISVIDTIEDV